MNEASLANSFRPHIHYVFTQFPIRSEAFARVELRGLQEAGCQVSASAFRKPVSDATGLLEEHGLEQLDVSHGGPAKWLRGLFRLIEHPVVAWRVTRKVLVGITEKPKEILIGLMILPRGFGIALEIADRQVDHVHLFWGHYPSVVGLVVKEMGQRCSISMFIGAYDLVREFPPSRVLAQLVPVTTHSMANVPLVRAFTGLGPGDIRVIHRGIRVPPIPNPGLRATHPHILVVERLTRPKRTLQAVEVFARVVCDVPDAILTILGEGPERLRLEQYVAERGFQESVRILGHVPHSEVQATMARAHILLSMSQSPSERLPNAAKEAMALRCAVVVARTPGIEELVVDGETGYIVRPGGIEEAAGRIVELLSAPEKVEKFGSKARKRIIAGFDIQFTTEQRLAFWQVDAQKHCV